MNPDLPRYPRSIALAARELLLPRLREAVDQIPPPLHTPCAYYFGWVDQSGRQVAYRGTNFSGAALVLLGGAIDGGSWLRARELTTAMVLIHSYALIMDDVIDGDPTRRGFPTVWKAFGIPTATLTADILLTLGFTLLAEHSTRASRIVGQALQGALCGQAMDVDGQRRCDITLDQALDIADRKTSNWAATHSAVGALCTDAVPEQAEAIRAFGWHVGRIMQLRDDIADIYGDEADGSPPKRSDLKTRKKTAIVCAALQSDHAHRQELADYYQRPDDLRDDELDHIAALIEQSGARDWAEGQITHLHQQAHIHARNATDDPELQQLICGYADLITQHSVGDTRPGYGAPPSFRTADPLRPSTGKDA